MTIGHDEKYETIAKLNTNWHTEKDKIHNYTNTTTVFLIIIVDTGIIFVDQIIFLLQLILYFVVNFDRCFPQMYPGFCITWGTVRFASVATSLLSSRSRSARVSSFSPRRISALFSVIIFKGYRFGPSPKWGNIIGGFQDVGRC